MGTKIELVSNPTQLAHFNTDKANWDLFASSLQSNIVNSRVVNSKEYTTILDTDYSTQVLQNDDLPITQLLDNAATEVTTAITRAAKCSIPTTTQGARPKSWWSQELKTLRKDMMRKQRNISSDSSYYSKLPYLQAKNSYFLAIKQAKRDH